MLVQILVVAQPLEGCWGGAVARNDLVGCLHAAPSASATTGDGRDTEMAKTMAGNLLLDSAARQRSAARKERASFASLKSPAEKEVSQAIQSGCESFS